MTDRSEQFAFGKNWRDYLSHLDEERMAQARRSLQVMLGRETLEGVRLLDAGSGSGLFSLAALQLGARSVVSFDRDADSVQCARQLNETFGPFPRWEITRGNVLDREWLAALGEFHVVYSWGVLHHTGALWRALDNVTLPVTPGGLLYISIYNDQGAVSRFWRMVKSLYNRWPRLLGPALAGGYLGLILLNRTFQGLTGRRPPGCWYTGSERGMTLWNDAVDWVGGYPFETATPESVERFLAERGFSLRVLRPTRGSGCNEFVFERIPRGLERPAPGETGGS